MRKRERGDDESGPPQGGKRAAGPRGGESSEGAGRAENEPPRLTTDDALQYLKDVKEKFKDDKQKYNEFLEVMKDFKAQRVDTAGVIARVRELFKGHRHLILGFNTFLPHGYAIKMSAEEEKKPPPVEFDQAINYVNKIKLRFHKDEHVYKAFLEILNMYRKGNKTINEVYQEVASLFEDHSDLLEEFTYFLPDTNGSSTPSSYAVVTPDLQPRHPQDARAFGGVNGKHVSERHVSGRENIVGVPGERNRHREPERRVEKTRKVGEKSDKKDIGRRLLTATDGSCEDRERKERNDREEGGRDKDSDFAEHKPKRASARNASDAIRRQSQAGEGGESFPGPAPQASTDDKKAVKVLQYPFFDKVKSRLRSRDTYQEFLKCLNIFSQEIIGRQELQNLVGDILGKHADLMEGFKEFLAHCENVEGYLEGAISGRKLGEFAEGAPLKAVKMERDGDQDRNREKDREREKEKEKEKVKIVDKERDRDLKERQREVKPVHTGKDGAHKPVAPKDKYANKSISELDLSNCERCTPSYRLLPKNYPRPASIHRSILGNSVLNDNWVSVTSGSEDYSFKHMRKNQYEESLFRCEDDRYELDMLRATTAATAKKVGEYVHKQEGENGKAEALPPVEEFLSPIFLRCIERIYGDHGLDILEVLKKSTPRAMPVIHSRLVQKEEEWTKCREEMNKVWAEVYAKNVYKALDHRSFYFKQQDKKALSTKGLLTEIKDLNDKRKGDDDMILSIAGNHRRTMIPDLRYEFADASIHDDLYQIIKYSSEEISSSPEFTKKIIRMLRAFAELILGISVRPQGADDVDEGVRTKAPDGEGRNGNTAEMNVVNDGGSRGWTHTCVVQSSVEDECDETSSREGGGLGSGAAGAGGMISEGAGVERSGAGGRRSINEVALRLAGERSVGDFAVAEKACTGGHDHGSGVADQTAEKDLDMDAAGGTAARTEGSGWLHGENSLAKQRNAGLERGDVDARSVGLGAGSVILGNGSEGRGAVDREEGEMSPVSEQEDQAKAKRSPRRVVEGNGGVETFAQDEDGEGVGGTEMDHDQDEDEEGEVSAQKSSEDSETSSSEHSSDEQSEHEEEEDEQEEKVESEGEAEGMADADDGDEDGNSSLAISEHSWAHCKPVAVYPPCCSALAVGSHSKKAGRIFYGNDMSFIISRLYQTLYERILSAKVNAELAAKKKCSDGAAAPNLYSRFLQVLDGLLDGSLDNAKFEDECRAIIGTQSYVLFTLDELIFKLVKQLQAAAADDGLQKLLALNAYEYEREAVDPVYYADACVLLRDENIYRFEHRSNPSELQIQLIESSEKLDLPGITLESSFQVHFDKFIQSPPATKIRGVYLKKNLKKKQDDDADHDIMVLNGLEIKMACRSFKVSYVLSTEDVYFKRRVKRRNEKAVLEKKRIFIAWLDNQQN